MRQKLTVARLRATLNAMNKDRAVAADGWSIRELQQMPDEILQMIVDLLNEIEEGNREWPNAMVTGITTCMPKGEEDDEDGNVHEYEVAAAETSQTRPITNMSGIVRCN